MKLNKLNASCVLAFGVLLTAPFETQARPRHLRILDQPVGTSVIYGTDDRLDLYQVTNSQTLTLADATVALFRSEKVDIDEKSKTAKLTTEILGEKGKFCADEPFAQQPAGAFCSGSLVGTDLVMTAGHCIRHEADCESTKFVFGFGIKTQGNFPNSVPSTEVYSCAAIVARDLQKDGQDYALVRLNRNVENHVPLRINRKNDLTLGTELMVIGHPVGLPTKVAANAKVRKTDHEKFVVASLDTFGGNSGSAVFNVDSGLVEGILVRGEYDWQMDEEKQCLRSKICEVDNCRGEDVVRVSLLAEHIPAME